MTTKPTHSNTINTATETMESKIEKVQAEIIKTFKAIDKKQLMDFGNYSFVCTREVFESADPLIIYSRKTSTGLSFRAFINTAKIEKITSGMIEKLTATVYEDIKKTLKQEARKKEVEKKRAELQAAGIQWGLDDVKKIIKELDEKTGMEGAKIKIRQSRATKTMGLFRYYQGGEIVDFAFSKELLTFATEEELRDVIIHEYCHYWQFLMEGKTGHNKRFAELCRKLGGSGNYYFDGFSKLTPQN